MARILLQVALTLVCLLIVTFQSVQVEAIFDEDQIKCKVCDRAIAHIWHQGVELREHCAAHGTDSRCHISNMKRHGVEEMTRDVCSDLPKSHQALMESEFDLVVHDNPNHEPEVIKAIENACKRWVHDEHGVDNVSRIIFANLDAGKRTEIILHRIQETYCHAACKRADHVYDGKIDDGINRDGPHIDDL